MVLRRSRHTHEQMTRFAQKTLRHSVRIQDLNSNQRRQLVEWDDVEELGNPRYWNVTGCRKFGTIQQDLEVSGVAQGKHLEEIY